MPNARSWKLVALAVGMAAWGSSAGAFGEVSDIIFDVFVTQGDVSTGYFGVTSDQLAEDPVTGELYWHLEPGNDVEIFDPLGFSLAVLQDAYIRLLLPGPGNLTTHIELGFAVQAGDALTSFSFGSALLSFPAIANLQGQADAAFVLTDFNGDGATLTGLQPGGGSFRAQYNGFPVGSTFTELLPGSITVGSFESISVNDVYGFAPIGTPVSNFSTRTDFSLTASDLASGVTTFELIPEPAAGLLLVVGTLAARRR